MVGRPCSGVSLVTDTGDWNETPCQSRGFDRNVCFWVKSMLRACYVVATGKNNFILLLQM